MAPLMFGALLDALGLRAPARVQAAGDLRPGRAVVFGALHTEAPLRSPVHDTPCAAFYYRASFRRASRVKGFAQALLRDALVYADGLWVEVDGVRVAVEPRASVAFGRADHRALVAQGIDGFRAVEKRVPVGAAVAAHGVLRRRGEGFVLRLDRLDHDAEVKAGRRPRRSR